MIYATEYNNNLHPRQQQMLHREAVCRCRDMREYRDLESILDTTHDVAMAKVAEQCMEARLDDMMDQIMQDDDFMDALMGVSDEDRYMTRGNSRAY